MEERVKYQTANANLLQRPCEPDTMTAKMSRRQLACGLDELEREATQFERTLIQMLNQVRAIQGKRPVIVPKG